MSRVWDARIRAWSGCLDYSQSKNFIYDLKYFIIKEITKLINRFSSLFLKLN